MKQKAKNSLLCSVILFLLIFFYNCFTINAQLYTNKFDNNATLSPDSLFLYFKQPELPKLFYKNYNVLDKPNYKKKYKVESFQFVCKLRIDSTCKVTEKNMKIYPIYNADNNLPYNHKLWKMVIDSIKSASKNWIVKRIFWDLEKINDLKLKEIYRKSNNNELSINLRPFFGRQSHLMVLTIYPNVEDHCSHCRGESFNYIYRIEVE
jgi:hypothetical protein